MRIMATCSKSRNARARANTCSKSRNARARANVTKRKERKKERADPILIFTHKERNMVGQPATDNGDNEG